MKSTTPASLSALVKHVESILKREPHFFVSYVRVQHDPAMLMSLKLIEVRRPQPNDAGLSIIVDGLFEGRDGPHKFEATPETLAECGITGLTVGMGAAPFANGNVVKGMIIRICPSRMTGTIAAEVKAMFRAKNPATRLITLTPVKETKRYKEAALEISELDQEIRNLTKARDLANNILQERHPAFGPAWSR